MLPAYARSLLSKRRQGLSPTGFLFVCCTWALAKQAHDLQQWAIVAADDEASYDFGVCAGLPCFVCGPDIARVERIAELVADAKPSCVWRQWAA